MVEPAEPDGDDPLAPHMRFSTAPWRGDAAFDAWRERVSPISETHHGGTPFRSESLTWHLGGMIATRSDYGDRHQSRPRPLIRTHPLDHYRVTVQLQGRMFLDADGLRQVIAPGGAVITDLARPDDYRVEAGSNLMLFVPRATLDAVLPHPVGLHGVAPKGAAAALLADHVRSLFMHLGRLRQSETGGVAASTAHLIAAALAPGLRTLGAARPAMQSSLLHSARQHIDARLTDPRLSPASIGATLQVSRATLYRLFEPLGGVAAYIRTRRLERIHALLTSSPQRCHLAGLADAYGFSDSAQLSKAFKRQFGCSPRDVRNGGAVLPAGLPQMPAGPGEAYEGLGGWLRGLDGTADLV